MHPVRSAVSSTTLSHIIDIAINLLKLSPYTLDSALQDSFHHSACYGPAILSQALGSSVLTKAWYHGAAPHCNAEKIINYVVVN